jgi:SAM-dependent methyltransferase
MIVDLLRFKKELQDIEELLLKKNIKQSDNYKEWLDYFVKIYGKKHTDVHLYVVFSLIFFIAQLFTVKYVLNQEITFQSKQFSNNFFKNIKNDVKKKFNFEIGNEISYFVPLFDVLEELEPLAFDNLINLITDGIFSLDDNPEYMFDSVIQNFLSTYIRHKSGEFYTPPFLVKKMVEESYKFGSKVLDPCCGSGNFLVEIVKTIFNSPNSEKEKIAAFNNIYGYDINPISIFITKINFLFLLKEKISKVDLNLYVTDYLSEEEVSVNEDFDLIIGNPPWFTLRDVDSPDYQKKIKNLSEKLEIKPLPKNVLNIEIASLFFYKAKTSNMKNNAKIFFVITEGVINGSHAARFRNFKGFKNIKIWKFTREITKVFNVDFICIFAQKSATSLQKDNVEIPAHLFSIKEKEKKLTYFDNIDLKLEKIEILVPYLIETKGDKTYTNKLITEDDYKKLIPIKVSEYKKLFHKGADLNPRNLIFINYEKYNTTLVKINPDIRIFKRAKEPWDKIEFKDELVEKEYLFKVIKSTELVKFFVYDNYDVFLPLIRGNLRFNYSSLGKNAKVFYDKINELYLNYKKETTKNESLMDNLNRWSKLTNERQTSKIKVVYNNSGSIINAAVIQGDFIITGDLSFYSTDNLNEAYYLSAVLNSPLMTKQVKIKKSSRHIFKIPFEVPIKKFDINDKNHLKLAELAKKAQQISKAITIGMLKKNNNNISKIKIQKTLSNNLSLILKQIDDILNNELKS